MKTLPLYPCLLAALLPAGAFAQVPPPPAPVAPAPAPAGLREPDRDQPGSAVTTWGPKPLRGGPQEKYESTDVGGQKLTVPWFGEEGGRGVALSVGGGFRGDGSEVEFRLRIPLAKEWGLLLRYSASLPAASPQTSMAAALEVVRQSPIFLNLVRLYVGGGFRASVPTDSSGQTYVAWSPGINALIGAELFFARNASLFFDTGPDLGYGPLTKAGASGAGLEPAWEMNSGVTLYFGR